MTAAPSIWHLFTDGASDHRELVVRIPIRTTNPLNGSHRHWAPRARERKAQRNVVGLVVSGHLSSEGVTAPCPREAGRRRRFAVAMVPSSLRVMLTRLAPSSGLDDDNLRAALKAVRDGIADALGVDDRDPRVTWAYDQRRGKVREWAVEVRVTTGSAGNAAR